MIKHYYMIFSIVYIISFLGCSSADIVIKNNEQNQERVLPAFKKLDYFSKEHRSYFIGHSIGCSKNKEDARTIAENGALGDLSSGIITRIQAVLKVYEEKTEYQGRIIKDISNIEKKLIEFSNVHLPNSVYTFENEVWLDEKQRHCVSMIAYIERDEYFNFFLSGETNKSIEEFIREINTLLDN